MNPAVEFASPREGLAGQDFSIYPRAYSSAVLKRMEREGPKSAMGWRVRGDLSGDAGRTIGWAPEIGAAQYAMQRGDLPLGMLHAALGAAVAGEAGECRLVLPTPCLVGLAGYRMRLEGPVEVTFGGGHIRLWQELGGDSTQAAFVRTPAGWRREAATAADERFPVWSPSFLRTRAFEDRYVIATAAADPLGADPPRWPPCQSAAGEGFQEQAAQQLTAALDLICALGGHYRDWVTPVFRGVIASARGQNESDKSSSSPAQPGIVSLSFPIEAERLGQLLIHEISHQYFFIFNYVAPLTNGNDPSLYYSSLKRKERRIDKILLALHASANMALYWTDVVRALGPSPEREACLAAAQHHSHHLGAIVDRSAGLTPEGRQLWMLQKGLLLSRGQLTHAH